MVPKFAIEENFLDELKMREAVKKKFSLLEKIPSEFCGGALWKNIVTWIKVITYCHDAYPRMSSIAIAYAGDLKRNIPSMTGNKKEIKAVDFFEYGAKTLADTIARLYWKFRPDRERSPGALCIESIDVALFFNDSQIFMGAGRRKNRNVCYANGANLFNLKKNLFTRKEKYL